MCYVVLTKSVALMSCLQMIYYLPPAGCENINILVIILNSCGADRDCVKVTEPR